MAQDVSAQSFHRAADAATDPQRVPVVSLFRQPDHKPRAKPLARQVYQLAAHGAMVKDHPVGGLALSIGPSSAPDFEYTLTRTLWGLLS